MAITTAAALIVVVVSLVMATTPVYSYRGVFRSNEVREQDTEGLVAEMESLDREVARVMEELEKEEKAVMQRGKKKRGQVKKTWLCAGPNANRPDIYESTTLRADVLQFIDRTQPIPNDVACNTDGSLMLHQLMEMANRMAGSKIFHLDNDNINSRPADKSYAYMPDQRNCRSGYYESGTIRCNGYECHRNYRDAEMQLLADCDTVEKYWSVWTPCKFCQWSLMDWKDVKHSTTPVKIWVGELYTGSSVDKRTSRDCLSLMYHKGFEINPWNWGNFQQHAAITNQNCIKLVNLIKHCREYKTLLEQTRVALGNIRARQNRNDLVCVKPNDFANYHPQ